MDFSFRGVIGMGSSFSAALGAVGSSGVVGMDCVDCTGTALGVVGMGTAPGVIGARRKGGGDMISGAGMPCKRLLQRMGRREAPCHCSLFDI